MKKQRYSKKTNPEGRALSGRPLSAPIDFSKPNAMQFHPWKDIDNINPRQLHKHYHEEWIDQKRYLTIVSAYNMTRPK